MQRSHATVQRLAGKPNGLDALDTAIETQRTVFARPLTKTSKRRFSYESRQSHRLQPGTGFSPVA